ncbi:hypothetical protein FRB94_012336 [Tulasnella sp. JGI-2019a]|nr:hypothetical protein FRB94_012336 [Tulasnella sp. JGI-2019a]
MRTIQKPRSWTPPRLQKPTPTLNQGWLSSSASHNRESLNLLILPRFGPPFNLGRNPHTEIKNGINLDQSIKDHQEALRLQPEGHPSRAQTLSTLTVDLSMRFEQTGDRSDLDQSIKYGYEARTLWPDGNPGKAPLLANLSASLGKRYEQTHDIDDIEQRMMLLEQMRNLESDERQDSPTSYFDLPTQSGDQQQNMGAPAFEEDDPELRAGSLSDLSLRLWVQFEETGNRSDLDQSIEHGEEALKLWPEEHPFKAMSLSNLAVGLSKRFEQTKNNDDLDRSIEYGEEAVKLWPEAGESRVTPLSNLALGLTTRFKRTRKLIDLARSVEHLQEVAVLLPEDDPSRSETMCKMATAMRMMMEEVGNFRNRGRGAGF